MIDMGYYKTFGAQTFRCHFDPENQVVLARGPLPDLKIVHQVEAADAEEGAQKLSREIGKGVFVRLGNDGPKVNNHKH
jgi:hypothetical protein